ncbi:MAG TPA: MG2 domain-containing protein [Ignavibacteria bacterium]|jgi:hypothetical protein
MCKKILTVILAFIATTFWLVAQTNELEDYNVSYSIYTNNLYKSGEDVSITLSAYNIVKRPEFKFTIYKIKDVEGFFSRQTSNYSIDVLSKDSTNLLSLCEEVDNFTKTFKTQGYDNYYYFYETVNYRPASKGAFVVRASYKNKVAYGGFFITDIGMISQASSNGLVSFTVDRKSGDPINDVNLNFYLGSKKIGVGNTAGGLFYKALEEVDRQYAAEHEIYYPLIIGSKGDDIAVSDPYLYFGYPANFYSVYITTNQPVYRPKSKVEFKGVIRKTVASGFDNVGSMDVTIKIKDSKSAEVYKQVLKTNENGSFTGQFDIEENSSLGQYYIYAELGRGQSYTGTFNVEEYKKPEYKVDITLDKDQYTDGDEIKGVVQADYYFGSPVQEAEVTYNVYKKTFYKPWWYFSEYRWWYEDYYASQDDNQKYNDADFIYTGTGKLDKEGRFDFDYAVKEDFKAKNNYYWYYDYENKQYYETDFIYIIQAKVVDKSRREISSTKTVYVTRSDFYLVSNTDKYVYKPDEKVTLELRAADFGDKPKAVSFETSVNKITWGSYPDYKQKKEFVTTVSGSTNDKGYSAVTFDAAGEGYYSIEVKSYDNRGKKVTAETYCYVSNGDMWWWYNQSGTVQIYPDKDSYKPGEVCKALVVVTTPGVSVLISTYNNNILTYRVEKFDGTSKMIEFNVDESSAPNFNISASYVTNGTFYTGSKALMVIPEKKFLTVTIGTDKTSYKPKDEGTFMVKVTDNEGNPVSNAEVCIGVVDESIYAIKPDNTKDIRQFFYSPTWSSVSTHYNSQYYYYGYSRFITIYERFDVKNMSESELGTIKGRLTDKNGNAIAYATIVIDGDFIAATTGDDGSYEFKLPEGSYTISVLKGKKSTEGERELVVNKGKTLEVNFRIDQSEVIFNESIQSLNRSFDDGAIDEEEAPVTSKTKDAAKEISTEQSGRMLKKDGKGEDERKGYTDFVEPDLRSDFRDAIYWAPTVTTDGNGYATVKVKFPDNLTTWRTTARVVTSDTKVGQVVNTIITRKDLLVRMETPRFFQQGDEVTISTIVHNYLSTDKETKLNFKVENLNVIGDANEKMITMGKNEEKRIDWKVKVTEPMGFAKLTATALTNEESDAVELKVPLQPHGLQLAEYQPMDVADENKTEYKTVYIPQYTDLRSTKLTLNVAPSLASTMLTALDELVGYPYGCVEQTMSRFLPTVIVANAFKDLNVPISEATQKDLPKMVEAGFNRLYSMQHYDGGWGWWTNDQSHPFMTSYVVYGLSLGEQAGYNVRKDVLNNGVKSIKSQIKNKELDPTTRAYMIYAMSHVDPNAKEVYDEQFKYLYEAELNDYAIALVSMTAKNIGDLETARKFNEKLVKDVQTSGEGASYWGGQAWHYSWQDDKIQTTAMAIKALIADPQTLKDNPEIMNKAIRWLMMQRQGGGWWNTQSTAFIIYAMVDYLKTSKELDPDYTVKIYVNNELYVDKRMTKSDIFEKEGKIEIKGDKLKDGANEIRIEKNGLGKVYVASDLRYYTNEENIKPRENGFRVEKEYFKLEQYTKYNDNKITYRKRYFDGFVKSGDIIFVKVRVTAKEQNNQYFMLEDPIPAGCEVVKDDWAYTIDEEKDYTGWDYYWWRWWYADKDIRDNRVTFFSTYMYGDTYEFTYIMRAQIPGTYNVIPATGMLMYYPDVRGSSEELRLEITD